MHLEYTNIIGAGTGGTTKLLGEQEMHPAPPFFSATYK